MTENRTPETEAEAERIRKVRYDSWVESLSPHERKGVRAEERDFKHIHELAATPPTVGEGFKRWINQGDRDCHVFAAADHRYAYEYEMPGGAIFLRSGPPDLCGQERSVSWRNPPAWLRKAAPDYFKDQD